MMNNAVEVDALLVRRGHREVLHDLSLAVPAGQVTGLLGPSGSGKSTLIRAVVGVQVVESGTVTVLGEPAGSPALRSRVGYVTQSPSVYDDLSVRANTRYFARLQHRDRRTADSKAEQAIERVDLTDHADDTVGNLSGGQKSRVSLAAALVGDPDLLVLDEPTVGLDPVLRRDLWQLFHELAGAGTTLLVSSHVMDEATRCDRLLLLREGRILADETPAGLLQRTGETDAESAFLTLIEQEDA
jgi:ABC-2 type transport system ATP-binding protein